MYIPELIRKTALRMGLSTQTIRTYKQCVKQFFNYCKKDPKDVKKRDIEDYLDRLIDIGWNGLCPYSSKKNDQCKKSF